MQDKKKIVLLGLALAMLACVAFGGHSTLAQGPNRAGLVVDYGGSVGTYCVEFGEPELSGYDLLRRAGLSVGASFGSGMGAGICKIGDVGCGPENCFCGFPPNYWSYWHLRGGQWEYSLGGASSYRIHNGEVDAWRWGPGDPPAVVPFDRICAPPTNTPLPPTATPILTDTPVPPTNTPIPTDTPVPPTATPAPTDTLVPPTNTPLPTNAPLSATNTPTNTARPTNTWVPPTNTKAPTSIALAPTRTAIPATSTPVPTDTPVLTDTPIPTDTPVPPTSTSLPTATTALPTNSPSPIVVAPSTNTPSPTLTEQPTDTATPSSTTPPEKTATVIVMAQLGDGTQAAPTLERASTRVVGATATPTTVGTTGAATATGKDPSAISSALETKGEAAGAPPEDDSSFVQPSNTLQSLVGYMSFFALVTALVGGLRYLRRAHR